jgi:hypothetical protein
MGGTEGGLVPSRRDCRTSYWSVPGVSRTLLANPLDQLQVKEPARLVLDHPQ